MRPLAIREWREVLKLPVGVLSISMQSILGAHRKVIQEWVDGAYLERRAPTDCEWAPIGMEPQSFSPIFYYRKVKPK